MKPPKVSVLMPLYNTPSDHLKEAINSILSQTFSDFEYLIINDSPDNHELDKIVKSYDDQRIIYLKNPNNLGLEESTNKLIDQARGEYLAIFDHDDISLPNRLQKEVDYLDKHPKVGLVSAQFKVFGETNWISNNPVEDNEIKLELAKTSCVSHTSAMIRKSVLNKHNIRYEKKFFPAASYRLVTRLALVTDAHNLPDVLLHYRMDGSNTSLKHSKKRTAAREEIRLEYEEDMKSTQLKQIFKFDSVEVLGNSRNQDKGRYYKAKRGSETFFVKSGDHDYSSEFQFSKAVYAKDKKHFIEPVDFHKGDPNYFVARWNTGTDLDKYLKQKDASEKEKEAFLDDLYEISKVLWDLKIMHRDLTPRNFMVVGGRLVLVDFYWAVTSDYNKDDSARDSAQIIILHYLGEDYAAGLYKWDDAYSFVKIADYIFGEDKAKKHPLVEQIAKNIGKRVITPDPTAFYKFITEQSKHLARQSEQLILQQERITELEQQYLDILNSKSYKLGRKATAPYRAIKRQK